MNHQMQESTITFHLNESKPVSLICDVAGSFFEKTKGLMYRSSLPEGRGMLFPFLFSWYQVFWMKNVKFPLDILFINKDLQVVKIFEASADSNMFHKVYWAFGFCKYVVECNRGFCKKHEIQIGTKVSIKKKLTN